MMNYIIIINPNSGKKKSVEIFKTKISPILKKKKHDFEYYITEYSGHAIKIIKSINLKNKDAILVLGGDGTMHEVINGMLNRKDKIKIPIGNLPTGSGNSLLYDLGKYDIKTTLNNILKHQIRNIDLLEVSTKIKKIYSINLIGWGMGNDIGVLAEKIRWLGPMRYNVASIIEISRYKGRKAQLILDGEKIDGNYALIAVCNTIYVGKGMKMAPNAKLDDGKMDIIMIKDNFTKIELLKLFPSLFSGKHIDNKKVIYKQVESFTLNPSKNEILNIDGEITGRTPITVKTIPKALELLN